MTNLSTLELLEHSVLEEDLDSRPLEGSGTVRAFGSGGNPGW